MLCKFLSFAMKEYDINDCWFEQDGVTAHMNSLNGLFRLFVVLSSSLSDVKINYDNVNKSWPPLHSAINELIRKPLKEIMKICSGMDAAHRTVSVIQNPSPIWKVKIFYLISFSRSLKYNFLKYNSDLGTLTFRALNSMPPCSKFCTRIRVITSHNLKDFSLNFHNCFDSIRDCVDIKFIK